MRKVRARKIPYCRKVSGNEPSPLSVRNGYGYVTLDDRGINDFQLTGIQIDYRTPSGDRTYRGEFAANVNGVALAGYAVYVAIRSSQGSMNGLRMSMAYEQDKQNWQ